MDQQRYEEKRKEEVNKKVKNDDILNIVKVFISHFENTKENRRDKQ